MARLNQVSSSTNLWYPQTSVLKFGSTGLKLCAFSCQVYIQLSSCAINNVFYSVTFFTGKEPESPGSGSYHIKPEPISDEERSDDRLFESNYYYYSRSAGNLTGDERDQIFSLASIQPGNPAFVAVLHKTHVGHRNNLLVSSYIQLLGPQLRRYLFHLH